MPQWRISRDEITTDARFGRKANHDTAISENASDTSWNLPTLPDGGFVKNGFSLRPERKT